jgi:hypothetical protein
MCQIILKILHALLIPNQAISMCKVYTKYVIIALPNEIISSRNQPDN